MTYRDIERRGFLQGEKAGIEKGRAEGIAESMATIKTAISSGIITEETAHQILALMENSNNNNK